MAVESEAANRNLSGRFFCVPRFSWLLSHGSGKGCWVSGHSDRAAVPAQWIQNVRRALLGLQGNNCTLQPALLHGIAFFSNSLNKCVKRTKMWCFCVLPKLQGNYFFSPLSCHQHIFFIHVTVGVIFSLIMPSYHMLLLFVEDVSFRENNLDSSIFQATIH